MMGSRMGLPTFAAGALLVAGVGLASCTTASPTQADYAQYVRPFVGTQGTGHTFPGACVPFGMVQASPVTGAWGWEYCQEYVYTDTIVWGFSQDHLNGTGCTDLGDVLLVPGGIRSRIDKATEEARAGYYACDLIDSHVRCEITATEHVALYRLTTSEPQNLTTSEPHDLLIDLQHGPSWNETQYHSHVIDSHIDQVDARTLRGHLHTSVWVNRTVYFAIAFDHDIARLDTIAIEEPEHGEKRMVHFDLPSDEPLQVKVALSSTSTEAAQRNLEAEAPDWDFDAHVQTADRKWNDLLTRIDVEGTDEQKQNFYTAFYHALIQPNNIADCGEPAGYSTFSCWDTYRAAHPFYTLVMADRVDDMVQSLVRQADSLGTIPIWGLWGKDNYCMVGNHGVSIIAEAYHKGFRGFDARQAFDAIRRTQTVSHPAKSRWELYTQYGYFPSDLTPAESVSSTLESVYDDYAAWDMATLLGLDDDAQYFARRKEYWRNLFDPETRFMRPRMSDGTWRSPFDPTGLTHEGAGGGDYTEGNAWQYTWHVQHDVAGLIDLMGGEEAFVARLDTFFTTRLESTLSDVTGLIGQYAHGNEPSHHVAYLYALAGHPERTQELVRQLFDTQYSPRPDGLCGNDDCGQMSAWYMLSAMGFYPVDPVSGQYVLGAPQLPRITVHLTNGCDFTVIAHDLSREHLHVGAVRLNGKPVTRPYLTHEEIVQGGTLEFDMVE